MQTDELKVVLRTRSGLVLRTRARAIEAEDLAGRFVISAGGEPMLTALVPGEIVLHRADGSRMCAKVGWGSLAKVAGEVRLVVDDAEQAEPCLMPLCG